MNSPSSGAFTRGLLGGLAGGFIGSMLFRNSGFAGTGTGMGGGGIGILEILLLLGLAYMGYRMLAGRKLAATGTGVYRNQDMSHYDKLRSVEPGPYEGTMESTEQASADELRRYDRNFNLASFKEERMDDFMRLQAAWGQRDLSELSGVIAPEMKKVLDGDLAQLKVAGRINRIENIAVRGVELVEAWVSQGKEYATVHFRASLTDYTVNDTTGELIEGSRTQPVKFEEDWTFVRELDQPGSTWKLSAIEV